MLSLANGQAERQAGMGGHSEEIWDSQMGREACRTIPAYNIEPFARTFENLTTHVYTTVHGQCFDDAALEVTIGGH